MTMQNIKDKTAQTFFGTTTAEAQSKRTCINCGQPICLSDEPTNKPGNIYSHAGAKEYKITGLCEYCFDNIMAEPEE